MRLTQGHTKLHSLMDARSLSVAGVARDLGVKYWIARNLVGGTVPRAPVAEAIARIYAIPVSAWEAQ